MSHFLLPLLISLVFFVIVAYSALPHTFGTYATETDFYHLYAPDAERIADWRFPENPFQGPGYPALVATIGALTGDLFVAGKWLSLTSAAVVVLLTFLLFEQLFGYWIGICAQLLLAVSDQFPRFAMQATTDVPFLMLCLAAVVIFLNTGMRVRWRVVLCAVVTGLAYLTRYNGLFLTATFLLGIIAFDIFRRPLRERLLLAAAFTTIFLLVSSPWFYANYKHRGSPLYNTNYLNIATEYYPELADENVMQEGTRKLGEMFHSFGEVLSYDPGRIVRHYPEVFYESVERSITSDLVSEWVGWLALIGCVLALVEGRSSAVMLVLSSGLLYFLLLALTHWETRYYFYIMALYSGFAVYAVFGLFEQARARGWLRHPAFVAVPAALIAVMWFTSFAAARKNTARFLASHPREILKACSFFRQAQISGARVVARKPHVAYICRQEWVFFPPVKSLDELNQWLRRNPVDYVTISSVEISRRRELAMLKDPANAPPWLRPVWVNDGEPFVLYRPALDEAPPPDADARRDATSE